MKTTEIEIDVTYKGTNARFTFTTGDDWEEAILDFVNDEAGFNNTDDFEEITDLSELTYEIIDWGEVDDYENLHDIDVLNEIAETSDLEYYDWEVISAALYCDVQISDISEAYQGQYKDDADFAENLCTEVGDIPSNLPSYIYIDWERTANDIMMDYSESDGYYFRRL